MGKLKQVERTPVRDNCIHKETRSRLNCRSTCKLSVQNLLLFLVLFKNIQDQVCAIIISLLFCPGMTWPATLREGVFTDRALRTILGYNKGKVRRKWRILHKRRATISVSY